MNDEFLSSGRVEQPTNQTTENLKIEIRTLKSDYNISTTNMAIIITILYYCHWRTIRNDTNSLKIHFKNARRIVVFNHYCSKDRMSPTAVAGT
jgi:hypothetical protein